jgi:hypothetical protein
MHEDRPRSETNQPVKRMDFRDLFTKTVLSAYNSGSLESFNQERFLAKRNFGAKRQRRFEVSTHAQGSLSDMHTTVWLLPYSTWGRSIWNV